MTEESRCASEQKSQLERARSGLYRVSLLAGSVEKEGNGQTRGGRILASKKRRRQRQRQQSPDNPKENNAWRTAHIYSYAVAAAKVSARERVLYIAI